MRLSITLLIYLSFVAGLAHAQKTLLQWYHLDPLTDKTIGISTKQAYHLLQTLPKPKNTVVVAVIDGGVDTHHEDPKAAVNLYEAIKLVLAEQRSNH